MHDIDPAWKAMLENTAEKILMADGSPYGLPPGAENVKHEAIEALELCLGILYSGIFGKPTFPGSTRSQNVRTRLARLAALMPDLIRRAWDLVGDPRSVQPAGADAMTHAFIEDLPSVQTQLAVDLKAAYEGDPAAGSPAEVLLSYPCVEAIATYRLAHRLYREKIPLIPRLMAEWSHSRTGIDIHPGASIGPGFFIDHGTGVVIGETSVIGRNVKLYQGVTLGARSFKKDEKGSPIKGLKRHPDIEDNVTIYAGATILGGETTIGRNSIIGGNCWVTESVPADSVVAIENGLSTVKPKPDYPPRYVGRTLEDVR
jgi:serine O-acetyltransferase